MLNLHRLTEVDHAVAVSVSLLGVVVRAQKTTRGVQVESTFIIFFITNQALKTGVVLSSSGWSMHLRSYLALVVVLVL